MMDLAAVNLAKAIRQKESGGNFDAVGDNGTSTGAYQWQAATWKSHAAQILGNANAEMTPANQNAVAYGMIKKWKDAGLNVAQIAAKWNSGSEKGWENKIGTKEINGKKISYNVPQYVKDVTTQYQLFKQSTPSDTTKVVETPVTPPESEVKENNIFQTAFVDLVGRPAIRLSQAFASAAIRPFLNEEHQKKLDEVLNQPVTLPLGLGTVEPQKMGAEGVKQIAGNALVSAAYLYSGPGGAAARPLVKGTEWFGRGFAFGSGNALSEGKTTEEAVASGVLSGTISLGLGVTADKIGQYFTKQLVSPVESKFVRTEGSSIFAATPKKDVVMQQTTFGKLKNAYIENIKGVTEGGNKRPAILKKTIEELNAPLHENAWKVAKEVFAEQVESVKTLLGSKTGLTLDKLFIASAVFPTATVPSATAFGAKFAIQYSTKFLQTPAGKQFMLDTVKSGITALSKVDEPMRSHLAAPFIQSLIGNATTHLVSAFETPSEDVTITE